MFCLTVVVLCISTARPAWAWQAEGHQLIARTAAAALPGDVPAFLREADDTLAEYSTDPDAFKDRNLAALAATEGPEHFIDLEKVPAGVLEAKAFPPTRQAYDAMCKPPWTAARVGTLPYSILEGTQRLTLALAQHRRWPEDRAIRAKCLVFAGLLAHYSGDAVMPLHTTVNFDGPTDAEGKSPRSGIHDKIDALPGRMVHPIDAKPPAKSVRVFDDVLKATWDELQASHALVGKCYELEVEFPNPGAKEVSPRVQAFCAERMRAGSAFTASLFLTAWNDSEKIELPEWVVRAHDAAATQPAEPSPSGAVAPEGK
jgi:hypothetical protein